jgi:hypothetical protein
MTRRNLYLIIILFLPIFSFVYSQDNLTEIVSNSQGIKQDNKIFFEVEGYSVLVQLEDQPFNDQGLFILRNRYFIEKDTKFTTDTSLKIKNRSYALTSKLTKGILKNEVYYILYYSDKESRLVKFINAGPRDIKMEQLFVKAIINDLIPKQQFASITIDTIYFAGRKIKLGTVCQWMEPHNIQCDRLGQMNWSEYRTLDKAKSATQIQHDITANKFGAKLLEEKEVSVTFEGEKTKALMTKWKIKIPKMLMGGSNILIVFYVTEKVRDKFISCTMSHYSEEAPEGKLPKMLTEIMQLTD